MEYCKEHSQRQFEKNKALAIKKARQSKCKVDEFREIIYKWR